MGDTPAEDIAGAENGQTGSTEGPECYPVGPLEPVAQGPCGIDLEAWTRAVGRAELVTSACTHGLSADALPVCECRLRLTRLPGDDRLWEGGTEEVVTYPGNRPSSCSEYSRTPSGCLYCGSEFPGCSLDAPRSCDAVCAEMATRYDAEVQKTFSVTLRRLSCGADYTCEFVTEIDNACYARNPRERGIPAFDCALSDEQLLAHKSESAEFCRARPTVACETGSDCPRGLACDDTGTCTSCTGACADSTGVYINCPGQPACGDGEVCVEGRCLINANVECAFPTDCTDDQSCVLSGIDETGGRGNADTRSLCVSRRSAP